MAKNAETASRPTSVANSQLSGKSSVKALAAPEDELEDYLAAHVGEQQRGETRQRPAHRRAAAPAAQVVAGEQRAEDCPRQDGEEHLVGERERLDEELLGEERPAHDREREQNEGGEQDPEEQRLHLEERRDALQEWRQDAPVQPLLLGEHHQRVDRRHGEEAVSEHRDREMQREQGIA